MKRLAIATLLCALGTTQGSAQTVVSQGIAGTRRRATECFPHTSAEE